MKNIYLFVALALIMSKFQKHVCEIVSVQINPDWGPECQVNRVRGLFQWHKQKVCKNNLSRAAAVAWGWLSWEKSHVVTIAGGLHLRFRLCVIPNLTLVMYLHVSELGFENDKIAVWLKLELHLSDTDFNNWTKTFGSVLSALDWVTQKERT